MPVPNKRCTGKDLRMSPGFYERNKERVREERASFRIWIWSRLIREMDTVSWKVE